MLKVSTAGDGLLAKCRVIPAGNDSTISPTIFTTHLRWGGRLERGGEEGREGGWRGWEERERREERGERVMCVMDV